MINTRINARRKEEDMMINDNLKTLSNQILFCLPRAGLFESLSSSK